MNMSILPKELEVIIFDYKYQLEICDKKQKLHNELISKVKLRNTIYIRYTYYKYYNNETGEIKNNEIVEGGNFNFYPNVNSIDELLVMNSKYDNAPKCIVEHIAFPKKVNIADI